MYWLSAYFVSFVSILIYQVNPLGIENSCIDMDTLGSSAKSLPVLRTSSILGAARRCDDHLMRFSCPAQTLAVSIAISRSESRHYERTINHACVTVKVEVRYFCIGKCMDGYLTYT